MGSNVVKKEKESQIQEEKVYDILEYEDEKDDDVVRENKKIRGLVHLDYGVDGSNEYSSAYGVSNFRVSGVIDDPQDALGTRQLEHELLIPETCRNVTLVSTILPDVSMGKRIVGGFPTSGLNCVGGNGEIFEDELQALNQILQLLTQNSKPDDD